jgi:hypothetical protein
MHIELNESLTASYLVHLDLDPNDLSVCEKIENIV